MGNFVDFVLENEDRRRRMLFGFGVRKSSGFDPDQPRDKIGQWTDTGAGQKAGRKFKGKRLKTSREAAAWVKKNPSVSPEVSEEAYWALGDYKEIGYEQLNSDLRKAGSSSMETEEGNKMTDVLDAAIAESELPTAVFLYRGVDADVFAGRDDWTGEAVTDAGYASTSLVEAVVNRLHEPELMLEIQVSKGARGLWLDEYGGEGILEEAEILLPRNSEFKVISDSGPGADRRLVMELL